MQTAKDLIELCKDKHVTVSSCESLTAGLFTSTLASIPGASAVLKGGFVTYFTEMKQVMAHVEKDLIDTFGVVFLLQEMQVQMQWKINRQVVFFVLSHQKMQ